MYFLVSSCTALYDSEMNSYMYLNKKMHAVLQIMNKVHRFMNSHPCILSMMKYELKIHINFTLNIAAQLNSTPPVLKYKSGSSSTYQVSLEHEK